MKRLLTVILLLVVVLSVTSCEMQEAPSEEVVKESGSRFIMINWSSIHNKPDVGVYVDTHTGVAYSITQNGSLMPLYDTDGSILIYEEYIK